MGEIIVAASLDEYSNLQINPAVTLVTLGDSLDWQLPSNTDLFLKSQEISEELDRLAFDWEDPQNESLRSQYPEVANSGTYALYAFFNYNLDRLQRVIHIEDFLEKKYSRQIALMLAHLKLQVPSLF